VLGHAVAGGARAQHISAGLVETWVSIRSWPRDADATNRFIRIDPELNRHALDRARPPNTKPDRYRAPDSLLAFLESL
jgi:hypothetical protein